jgi:aspartate/methionine/tyrosine aminotransferase
MVLKAANRGRVPPFIVMDVMRAANEREASGERVLHLEVGQPSTGAPALVVAAAKAALDGDRLGYTDALGIPALRQRIAHHYRTAYGIEVEASRVVVTTGSSGAFILSFLAAFDVGDRVALASPGYPAYRNILQAQGVEAVDLAVGPETNFQPTPEILEAVEGGLDGLIVASPSNPTGTMMGRDDLKSMIAYCAGRGIRVVSDEIYHGITYGEAASSALSFTDDALVINSFSKYFSMTGWRLGWMVAPEDLLRPIECLAQNLFISPPTLSQHAALAAFDCADELDGHLVRYGRNRTLLLEELPKADFGELASADGAFYIYADVGHMTNDSQEFCQRMLAEIGVAATPGNDFDPSRGHRFVRFSFAGSTQDMAAAADLLRAWRQGMPVNR